MKVDLINPYVIKIIIAARDGDSTRAISQRIHVSYGWTYKWVQALVKAGAFRLVRTKVYNNKKNEFYKKTVEYIRKTLSHEISFYYAVLNLFGITYCFTKTDAVFMWSKGGYNIARYKEFYPIFVKVKRGDKQLFERYCRKLHLNTRKRKEVFYNVSYVDKIDIAYVGDTPVDPLDKTIRFIKQNRYNFEPALEMIKEMYQQKIKVKYREVLTNV